MSASIGITDLDIGVSYEGMLAYIEQIQVKILQELSQEVWNEMLEICKVLETGWVGKSLDRFRAQLYATVNTIKDDLKLESEDLSRRLLELAEFYYNQDKNMMD